MPLFSDVAGTLQMVLDRGNVTTTPISFNTGSKLISETGVKIQILPTGTAITQIGDAGSTSHSLTANDDLFISGKFEADGSAYFDGTVFITAGFVLTADTSTYIQVGGAGEGFRLGIGSATDRGTQLSLGVTGYGNNVFTFVADQNKTYDFGHTTMLTNPTVFVHATGTSQVNHINFSHDQTDAVINSGAGDIYLNPAGSVKFGTHSAIGAEALSGFITINDAGGTPRKLAVIS